MRRKARAKPPTLRQVYEAVHVVLRLTKEWARIQDRGEAGSERAGAGSLTYGTHVLRMVDDLLALVEKERRVRALGTLGPRKIRMEDLDDRVERVERVIIEAGSKSQDVVGRLISDELAVIAAASGAYLDDEAKANQDALASKKLGLLGRKTSSGWVHKNRTGPSNWRARWSTAWAAGPPRR
jgi:beta-glucosidase-like glycosyl hydrolase